MSCTTLTTFLGIAASAGLALQPVAAQDDADLAMQLSNPISSLISVPIQVNYDDDIGLNDAGSVVRINVQPVIPFSLNDDWSVPINAGVSQVLRLGNQLVQIGGGVRYWVSTPDTGPEGWGLRFNFVLLFPK